MNWNKEDLIKLCFEKTNAKLVEINAAMDLANDSLINDTKSSMGDKYETSREMAQQELSRLQNQLNQVNKDLTLLNQLNHNNANYIGLGSLVITDQFVYFIAISLGALKINEETVMVISPESPIGKLLLGKKILDTLTFNGKNFQIKNIL